MSASTKIRRSSLLVRTALWLAMAGGLHATPVLPCFLADNHAETFGWITRAVDLDQAHTLVLIDAHSDASSVERSEEIREELRRVSSLDERAARVEAWRKTGRIQAFNWIEPLMPRPVAQIRWCPAATLSDSRSADLTGEATGLLDGRLEVELRSAGSFASRWTTMDLADGNWEIPGPVILAVDLDFFAGMPAAEREETFERIWRRAMTWPGLRGVAFAVSRPWLVDDAEADALVSMAVAAVSRTRGATLEMHGEADGHPDGSLRAAELADSGKSVPRWSLGQASAALRVASGNLGDRLRVTGPAMIELPPSLEIRPDAGEVDCDGVWRFPAAEAPPLRTTVPEGATGRVRWFALESSHSAVDLWPETGLGKGFSNKPARWIYETRRSLGTTEDFALAAERWKPAGGGRVRVQAEIETAAGWLLTAPVEIRLATATGFRGALSECFGMPYVFGIAGVEEADLPAVETGWGSDCSNFLIHAWRRQGVPLAWGDPGRLRAQLVTVAEDLASGDETVVSAEQIERGVAIDFGYHMAALWEDREPVGRLGGNDLVAHHLGGFPEIVTLADLAEGRPRFALRIPVSGPGCVVRVAGDVVLAGDDLRTVDGFERRDAMWFFANLEGMPSLADPESAPRFDFRFPKERLARLNDAGVDAVSMANNHGGDAGLGGLLEGLSALRAAGIGTAGAGENAAAACKPWRSTRQGVRIAFFGVCLTGGLVATADQPGVAHLPKHADLLESELRAARDRGERIVVLMHGGDEYHAEVNADQRRWARWLVRQGATLVAGAHPHVLQRTETHAGSVISHSLGNAVYPARLKGADSGEVRSFQLPLIR